MYVVKFFDKFKKNKKNNDNQTHPGDIEESEDFALKPLFDSNYGIKDLDLLETVGE